MPDLTVTLPGLNLKNPIIPASGTFGYGLEFTPYGDLRELGAIVVKGLSLKPRQGNPMQRIAETPCGMLNAIGIQNIGVEAFLAQKLPKLPWQDTPVIVNLYAQSATEFGELAGVLAGVEGVAALEVNISCPNVKQGGAAFGQDPDQAAEVTRQVKVHSRDKPVMVKLSPNVTDIAAMAKVVADAGADMLSLINTLKGMAVDLERRAPRLSTVIGGLSGPAIKPVALRCVYEAVRAVDIPVIGLGGITSADDVLEFLLVGAHAVQVGTANFLRPDFSFRLVHELRSRAEELGISSWDEFRNSFRLG